MGQTEGIHTGSDAGRKHFLWIVFVGFWACLFNSMVANRQIQGIKMVQSDVDDRPGKIVMANTTSITKKLMKQSSAYLLPPLIIGAGQGTTGSRTMQDAMCCLGIPSLHYGDDCTILNLSKKRGACTIIDSFTDTFANFSLNSGLYDNYRYEHSPRQTLNGFRQKQLQILTHDKERNKKVPDPHPGIRIIWQFIEMIHCLDSELLKLKNYKCPGTDDMAQWAEDLKSLIDDVLRWHDDDDPIRNVGAIHDSPYTFVLPHVIESAKRLRGQDPMILFTERDPVEWADRRMDKHEFFFCRHDLIHGFNESNNHLPTSHFHWFECIDRTIRAKEESQGASNPNEKVRVGLHEVFTTFSNLMRGVDQPKGNEWVAEDLHSHVKVAIEKYQNFWRDQSNLHWNFFEHSTSTMEIAAAAHELFSSSGAFQKSRN